MKNVGSRVRAARIAKDLTQIQLGQRTGIDQGRMSRIERGTGTLSVDEIARIARALNVSAGSLVDGPVDPDNQMSPALRALLAGDGLAPGLADLARSVDLVRLLGITDRELQTLASIDLPGKTDRDGYVQLLLTVRNVCFRPRAHI